MRFPRATMRSWITLTIFFLYLAAESGRCLALRGLRLAAPEAARAGDAARLACNYDLEGAALYSIKWYRDEHEFYRYLPKEAPPTRVFPLPGVHVDVSRSDERIVTLLNVGRRSAGLFKCEVSADAPLFHTDIQSALLRVAEVPAGEPEVATEKARYATGERISANCTAPPSLPAANLTWFVNDHLVDHAEEVTYRREEAGGALERAVSELRMEADTGRLALRCEATLYHLYRGVAEAELWQDAPRPASVLGPAAGRSGVPKLGHTAASLTVCLLVVAATR